MEGRESLIISWIPEQDASICCGRVREYFDKHGITAKSKRGRMAVKKKGRTPSLGKCGQRGKSKPIQKKISSPKTHAKPDRAQLLRD
jgi:hypothetical protein